MAAESFSVQPLEATTPLILAIDIGSTGSRGCIYDATGRPVDKHRIKVRHTFTTAPDGHCTLDPKHTLHEVIDIIDTLTSSDIAPHIAGVAMDTFAPTLIGIDTDNYAITPCLTYADSRASSQAAALRRHLDPHEITQRTGAHLHTAHWAATIRWWHDNDPQAAHRVHRWVTLGEYIWLHLLGVTNIATSTAAWTGLLNRYTCQWDAPLLEAAGIVEEHLSPIADPDQPSFPSTSYVPNRWPALAQVPWYPVIPDGLAANLGADATSTATPLASFATSGAIRVITGNTPTVLPPGLWCYRVDQQRSILGGALNDVGRMNTWLENVLQLPDPRTCHDILMADPASMTPLVLPFLTGERSTGWAGHARGALRDVSYSDTPAALYRGCFEGVALTYARLARQLFEVVGAPDRLRAAGRVSTSVPALLQLVADATGVPVEPVAIKRSTMHGTALYGLASLAPEVPRCEVFVDAEARPFAHREQYYADRMRRFEDLYDAAIVRNIGGANL
ncbi:gluconokinase [Dermatophilus congolensis]|uniref:gluconokinase n=1 Tax=Dermatophilus congolensis TaxID=1863 RepID=UPI001AAFADE2|nr:gluconokinase [Dermatophilus congolensis]MBO3143845.1 gluconokinase [Dermatophilus congolensis]MBO3152836.1 gluconokinase [Dermatophilus congolensis]MBO3160154.1 gluconokinase [Dermatophilus congolensis]MBO3164121.1 gluconokinase [Dermatophilus congolensis]MBO3177667.1 gluconokinase [Dermatophilus congolensis]